MPVKTVMSLNEFRNWMSGLSDNLFPAAKRGIIAGAKRCIPILHTNTRFAPATSVNGFVGVFDTGSFLRAWKSESTIDGAIVFNDAVHSPMIEHGRRPGKGPPPDVISKWARRKLGLSRDEAKSVGFLIGRKISRHGLKGRHILATSLPEMEKIVIEEMLIEINKEIDK